jgi:hypothetical protein
VAAIRRKNIETVIAAYNGLTKAQKKWTPYKISKYLLETRGVTEIAGFGQEAIEKIIAGTYPPAIKLGLAVVRDTHTQPE